MAESGFTATHTTTNTRVQTDFRFDDSYIRTVPGMLKCAQIVLNLLGFIALSMSGYYNFDRINYFKSVSMFGFWFTGILLVLYLFHAVEKFYKIPWLQIEMIYCALCALLYLIASLLILLWFTYDASFSVGAFFGFCALAAYAYDAWLKYNGMKAGEIAQGERTVVSKTTSSTYPPPAYPGPPAY